MVALLGASGSGKSTLLRHVAGFVAGDQGDVDVLERPVQRGGRLARDVRRRRAEIGCVLFVTILLVVFRRYLRIEDVVSRG